MNEITIVPMPEGPWVVVMGMHRSGTSAVAGALGALGFNVPCPQDRIHSPESNPEHWESHSIMLHNDAILERLGGAWDAPPDLPEGWEQGPELEGLADPTAIIANAYPDPGPLMWKDPRVCILFPYWRRVLPAPLTVVFVWRSPFAVARSLHRRDGLQLLEGVSLWERYNRSALEAASGCDTYVIGYEGLMDDPVGSLGALTDWLKSLKQFSGHASGWDVGRAGAAITDGLRHQPSEGDDRVLLSGQHQLVNRLSALQGGHQPLEGQPDIVASEWATTILEVRRQLHLALCNIEELKIDRYRELLEFQAELARVNAEVVGYQTQVVGYQTHVARYQAELERLMAELANVLAWGAHMQSSASWRVTKPLRSVSAVLHHGSGGGQDFAHSPPE
jgi:hypothetical protein